MMRPVPFLLLALIAAVASAEAVPPATRSRRQITSSDPRRNSSCHARRTAAPLLLNPAPREHQLRPWRGRGQDTDNLEVCRGGGSPDGAVAKAEAGEGGGTATMLSEIFNLVKSIVGAGVLSLPAGIAAFGDAPSALIPAVFLIAIIGGASGYMFSLIGRVCSHTGASTFSEAWSRTVGPGTAWVPAASSALSCLIANLAYSMILADTFKDLLSTIGVSFSRSNTLFVVTALILLPLCLLKNLSSLAPFSLLGIAGMAYTAAAMAISYLSGGYASPDGKFLSDLSADLQPSFGTTGAGGALSPNSLILICMLSTAYMAHFNAPKFYVELLNNTIERFNVVVSSSFGVSVAIFAAVAALGFLTFGSASSGLILNNYSTRDGLMSFSRVAVAVSIVFSYPLIFVGGRDGLLDLLSVPPSKRSDSTLNNLTVGILASLTALALKVKDLSFVLSFAGATMGNALIYVFPPLMFRAAVRNMGDAAGAGLRAEVALSLLAAVLGIGMGAVGSRQALKSL